MYLSLIHIFINQIMNVDLALKAKDDISKYMEFSFSDLPGFPNILHFFHTGNLIPRCV